MALEEQRGEQSRANPGTGEGSPSEGLEEMQNKRRREEGTQGTQ